MLEREQRGPRKNGVMPMVDTTPNTSYIKGLSDQENRELAGVLNPNDTTDPQSRLGEDGALQTQAGAFQVTLNETIEQRDNTENAEKRIELEERIVALQDAKDRSLEQRQLEETREAQEENISRLQKFKEWTKENIAGLSAIAISVAGIITSIIIGATKAIIKGATVNWGYLGQWCNLGQKMHHITFLHISHACNKFI